MSERHGSDAADIYDIYLIRACTSMPVVPDGYGPVPEQVVHQPPRPLHTALPLVDAQRYLRAIKDAGGFGWIAPVRYRHPTISPDQGLARAQAEFERTHATDHDYDRIELVRDEGVWWLYGAKRRTPWDGEPRAPGHVYLYIDKLDGHAGTLQEREEWAILSDVS